MLKAKRETDAGIDVPFACPRGADCCRVTKTQQQQPASPQAERADSPTSDDSFNSSGALSAGHDSGFASSSEPLPISSGAAAKLRVGQKSEEGLLPYDAASEPIFPAWLSRASKEDATGRSIYDLQDLAFVDVAHLQHKGEEEGDSDEEDEQEGAPPTARQSGTIWLRPASLSSLLAIMHFYQERSDIVKMRAGDSECRIEVKFLKRKYEVNVFVGNLPSLSTCKKSSDQLQIGATLPLQDVMDNLRRFLVAKGETDYASQVYKAILSNSSHFASTQIRNVACIGGNIATASPISDLNPVWLALGAHIGYATARPSSEASDEEVLVASKDQRLQMSSFFQGYRKTALPADAVITDVCVPLTASGPSTRQFVRAYKQAKRKDDDIAIVTCCLYMEVMPQNSDWVIETVRLAYGGMAPTTVLAKNAQNVLAGASLTKEGTLDESLLSRALDALGQQDFDLKYSVPGGMAVYRKSLALGFLTKFFSEVASELDLQSKNSEVDSEAKPLLSRFEQLASSHLSRPITRGSQDYENVVVKSKNASGSAAPHLSALKQCTGEAEYVDDHAPLAGELIGALVLTTKANAKIVSIDAIPALTPHGPATHFVGLEDVKRLGGNNVWCPPAFDDRFFCGDFSEAVGMVVGVVLAHTRREALDAARMVKVEYEQVGEPILDIDSAIAKESFFAARPKIQKGSDETCDDWSDCEEVVEGETRLGGQEHFYLETNAVLCIPGKEDQQMEVWSSTQNPTETQAFISSLLNIPMNRVQVRTKRLGGGFGGKESRSLVLACPMSLASFVTGRPVRCMLDRDEDIAVSGQRHPFMSRWKIGFNRDGKVKKLDAKVYNNAGWSQDLSRAVVERAMTHIDGVYHFDALRVLGFMCKTNTVSNTAFRGFGGPQGMMIVEDAMDHAARHIGMRPDFMRGLNMATEGEPVHFGQRLVDWNVPQMWQTILRTSDYEKRRKAVDEFNAVSRWKKRGISVHGTKFGISFTALHLNQARVLIHIYAHDGSIMLSHGGTEMGQGLHTKVAQICASELGVPLDKIHIAQTSTREAANTSATAASAGSDLNGAACKDACDQLNERLSPFRTNGKTFEQAAHDAYFARVNLSAVGHYRTEIKGMDWDKGHGEPFAYWTQGVCACEAEIDVLTGDSRIVRTDIIMDVARSINPGIDVGQIEGAVVQGIGLVTTEESMWRHDGSVATKGPGNYKIPAFLDTPGDLRVAFMKREEGRKAHFLKTVQGSKGIGEPPLALGAFHFFALKDAIRAARIDAGHGGGRFALASPATPERIRLACGDEIVQRAQLGAEQRAGEENFFVTIS